MESRSLIGHSTTEQWSSSLEAGQRCAAFARDRSCTAFFRRWLEEQSPKGEKSATLVRWVEPLDVVEEAPANEYDAQDVASIQHRNYNDVNLSEVLLLNRFFYDCRLPNCHERAQKGALRVRRRDWFGGAE